VIGGSGLYSGNILVDGNVGSLLIRGSLIGGTGIDDSLSAQVDIEGTRSR
jgi:hypothetical protein